MTFPMELAWSETQYEDSSEHKARLLSEIACSVAGRRYSKNSD